MTESPKRKLAYTVFARSEVTKQPETGASQSQTIAAQVRCEITAVILKQQDSLAMTGLSK